MDSFEEYVNVISSSSMHVDDGACSFQSLGAYFFHINLRRYIYSD